MTDPGPRQGEESEQTPMCGVPFHSAESYIARLVAKGYKVAICEQTEDPATGQGPGEPGYYPRRHPRRGDGELHAGRAA